MDRNEALYIYIGTLYGKKSEKILKKLLREEICSTMKFLQKKCYIEQPTLERQNKKISSFRVTGLKNLDRFGKHFFLDKNIISCILKGVSHTPYKNA